MRAGGTRRVLPWLLALAAAAAGLVLVALVPSARDDVAALPGGAPVSSSAAAATARPAAAWRVAQAQMGFSCQTDFGRCSIAPQPVGSPCWCGTTPGFVVN